MSDLALHHLGNVLAYFADLHDDDRCKAFDEALEYYNKHCPTRQVVSEFPGSQRLVVDLFQR